MQIFVEKGQLALKNNTYLVTGKGMLPVNNKEFYKAQVKAKFFDELSKEVKNHNFEHKAVTTIESVMNLVQNRLATTNVTTFIESGKAPKSELTDKLKSEAMDFMKYIESEGDVAALNAVMQEFVIIKKFEEVGLYFEQEVVELSKIYTIEEIIMFVNQIAKYL